MLFFRRKFFFFKTIKTVLFKDFDGNIKTINLQLPCEESKYFENIFANKNNYDLYIKNKDDEWEIKDLNNFNIIDTETNTFKII